MTTKTLGTNANNSLTALAMASGTESPADIATIAQAIKDDMSANSVADFRTFPGAYSQNGWLFVPNRGVLRVLPGDFVGVDHSGWPILVSADSIADASTSWTHT